MLLLDENGSVRVQAGVADKYDAILVVEHEVILLLLIGRRRCLTAVKKLGLAGLVRLYFYPSSAAHRRQSLV